MKIIKISVPGITVQDPVLNSSEYPSLVLEKSIEINSLTRAGGSTEQVDVRLDQFVELVYEDGTKWLCPPDTLEDFYPGAYSVQRDGTQIFSLPNELEHPDISRGLFKDLVLKAFNIFSKKVIKRSVKIIAEKLESKQLDGFKGLFKIAPNFELQKISNLEVSKPILLFIHGTNSSTKGSFSELLDTNLWNYALQTYDGQIVGFQHQTLTVSPLQNALELIELLPANANLHLVTHSRGGLVGEVVCRFSSSNEILGFTPQEIDYLKNEGRIKDVQNIEKIEDACKKKRFKVTKFIRIACPSGGTTILSKRLDHFLNISLNLLGTMPVFGSAVYVAMKELLVAIIDQKNDKDVLPGLEAMKPDSPFISVLNNQSRTVSIAEPIVAIAGNCKMKLNLKALLVLVSKLFYLEANDLVVNTKSMYAGSIREQKLQFFFDEGSDVDHFHYFKNERTNDAIMLALQHNGTGIINGFSEYDRSAVIDRNAIIRIEGGVYTTDAPSGKKPIVLLLPGIMGSCLTNEGQLTWIHYLQFLTGGLSNLSIDNLNIEASGIVKTSYKDLGDELKKTYDVVVFPFDWRLSIQDSAKLFERKIAELLLLKQPIKIIGHSMGGVLVRDFMVYHPQTWNELNHSIGFKLLFLGSPLNGSFRIANVLFGEDSLIQKLSKIDLRHTRQQLLEIFVKFPGILCLLPFNKDNQNNFADIETWNKMKHAFGNENWPIPTENSLKDFKKYRDKVLKGDAIDYKNAVYIAGQDAHTPCGYRIQETARGQELVFLSTAEGDQSVTWEMGIPKEMIATESVYYVNYSHGALSCAPEIFGAIKEILIHGKTTLLSQTRPVLRSQDSVFKKPETTDLDLSPEGLENTILGISKPIKLPTNELPLEIEVVHGDLKYSSYPVIAGHFKNDSILYAEARVDKLMLNMLSQQHNLGIYPGDIGTNEMKLSNGNFKGAIIVGLGQPDKLTLFELTKTIEQGTLKYLLSFSDFNSLSDRIEIGISSLIIGCGYGGLSVENAAQAIIQGVLNANKKVSALFKGRTRLITKVQLVELYEDRALACFYAVKRMKKDVGGSLNIISRQNKLIKKPGSRKQLNIDQTREWWSRITILAIEKDFKVKGLYFSISTGAAREDVRENFVELGTVEQLIENISTSSKWDFEAARAIFELLIPNDFKARLKVHGNIIWVLDKYTAGFPWEFLMDNAKDAKPLSINSGMIRQLATADTRINIEPVEEHTALIVGQSDFKGFLPDLPGALQEAKKINELLIKQGYKPNFLDNFPSEKILSALMCANYKIIHLAGHGVYHQDPELISGMVLDKNSFLTAANIKQMSTTPELVFVNCCYLGKVDSVADEFFQSRFKLASNLGTQLIEIGVKAVVVAGWAINDAAALVFSEKFYQNLFNGKPFGEAVRLARESIYNEFGDSNTWAAYQCYGDPYYQLRQTGYAPKIRDYVIPAQAEIDLQNLMSTLETGDINHDAVLYELNEITNEVERSQLRNQQITELEAMVYIAINDYEKAILKFETLFGSENSDYSLKSVEQYLNISVKHLLVRITQNPTKEQQKIDADFDKLTYNLKALIAVIPSAERYNILGSLFKNRMALPWNNNNVVPYLKESYENYYSAFKRNRSVYAYVNWATLKNILVVTGHEAWGMHKTDNENNPSWHEINSMLNDFEHENSQNPNDGDYWYRLVPSNIKLCKWMLEASAKKSVKEMSDFKAIVESYSDVWKALGTKDNRQREIDHLDLIGKGLETLHSGHFMAKSLKDLRDTLQTLV